MGKFEVGETVWYTMSRSYVVDVKILAKKKTWRGWEYVIEFGSNGIWVREYKLDKIQSPKKLEEQS